MVFYLHSLGPLLEIVVPEMAVASLIGIGPLFGVSLEYRIGSVSFEWVVTEDPYLCVADLPQAVAEALATSPTYALIELSDLSAITAAHAIYESITAMPSVDIDSDRKACRCDHDLNAFECCVDIKEVGLFVFRAAFVPSV